MVGLDTRYLLLLIKSGKTRSVTIIKELAETPLIMVAADGSFQGGVVLGRLAALVVLDEELRVFSSCMTFGYAAEENHINVDFSSLTYKTNFNPHEQVDSNTTYSKATLNSCIS